MVQQNRPGPQTDNRIAIIGRAGRFPAASNVEEFWSMLSEGRSAGKRLSEAELLAAGVSRSDLADPAYVRIANILPDMECFDAGFFGFSPREAAILDPQHRHFLEAGWEALEDAGHVPERFDGRIGVFAGSGMQAYLPYNLLSNPDLVADIGLFLLRHTGNDKDFLPTRLSYLLNLTGPSIAVQTACSTSLVAVHLAMSSLLAMECDMAIAGGVTIELPHRVGYRYAEGEILSPDGACRAFDDDSLGTVFGSGVSLVVLRRYEDALADGDDIKAVILASAVNNDGAAKPSYLAPSEEGQAEAAAEALALSGLAPEAISYIETHGTGTPIGDPIELAALNQVYGAAPVGSISIGSVKTNIGHLDTAAGTASLTKVVEALRHRKLPASLHFRTPNSRFDFAGSPFRVVAEGRDWESDGPRRAAVNSLGVGGTNAHVIIEEAPPRPAEPETGNWRVFPFSARNTAALERMRERWARFLDGNVPAASDIAFTLRAGRTGLPERFAVAARSAQELKTLIDARTSPLRKAGRARDKAPRVVFLFPGGGAQYPGAGAEMLNASPVFAAAVDECFRLLPPSAPADLREMMFSRDLSDAEARLKLTGSVYAIPALFILEYAYALLWEDWGVRPDAMLGHSAGEYVGAVVSGALTLSAALRIVMARALAMDASPSGAMATIPVGEARAREVIGEGLDIAAINTPATTVVSGPLGEIEALEARLAGSEYEARRIHIDVAAHSRLLDDQLDHFRGAFDGIEFGRLDVPVVSSLRGGWATGDDLVSVEYWVRHLRHTVRFLDALSAVFEEPDSIVIEVGPGQTLGPLVEICELTHPPRAILPSAPRPRDDENEMGVALAALGGLWANGVTIDFARVSGHQGRRVSLPTYPFEKERHWIEPGRGSASQDTSDDLPPLSRIPDQRDWVETLCWEERPRSGADRLPDGDWLVLAGRDAFSDAVLERLGQAGARVTVLRPGPKFGETADGFTLRPEATEDYEALATTLNAVPSRILSLWALDRDIAGAPFGPSYLLARFLQEADPGTGTRLTMVSAGATDVGGEKPQQPAQAVLLGAVRVAPREVPCMSAVLVDLPPEPGTDDVGALLAEAASAGADDFVALRDGKRWVRVRRPAPAPLPEALPARLRRNGTYVITGGTGGVGRKMALWLAETAGARVALIARNAAEDNDLRAEIETAGGEVAFLAADVTDASALESALDSIRARFGEINGVIHAAGVLDDALLAVQPLEAAQAVVAPKLAGAQVLDRLLPEGSLDFFTVISSSSVVIGVAGQTAYVAANSALEALAAARADGLSIAWGAWRDSGMAARTYGVGEPATNGDPLLGQRSDLADGVVVFESVIDPEKDWRVTEHVVGGQPVMPGSAYIEMAEAAARAVLGTYGFQLSTLSFAQPMTFDGIRRHVTVRLQPQKDEYELTIESSGGKAQECIEHVRVLVQPVSADSRLPVSLKEMPPLTASPRSGHARQEAVISFGPRWRNVGAIATGLDAAEGNFSLDQAFREDLFVHPAHPALLDMAATVGLNILEDNIGGDIVFVPMSVDCIRMLAPLPAKVSARARRVAGEPGRFVAFDVAIAGPDGQPVMVIEHLALRAIPRGALGAEASAPGLTQQLMVTGIRDAEVPAILSRVFNHPDRALVVSPVPLDIVRLSLAEAARKPTPRAEPDRGPAEAIADPVAARIATIWGEVLGVDDVRADDDFFALGGHSLNAVRMFARVRKEFGVNLPLATLFESPRLADVARQLRDQIPSVEESAPPAVQTTAVAGPAAVARRIGMTQGQREIAATLVVDPSESLSYNLSFSLHLEGDLKVEALKEAVANLVARHDGLRASFDLGNAEVVIHPECKPELEVIELSGVAGPDQQAERDSVHDAAAGRPFDLVNGPVFRALLFLYSATQAELVLFVHHIACDGWSMGVLMRDLAALYCAAAAGRAADLPPAVSLADLVAAEAQWAESADAERHRAFWLDKYRGPLPAVDLPTDRPHPRERRTEADRVVARVGDALEGSLRDVAERAGASLSNLIFSAFRYYLARWTRSDDLVVALPASGQLAHGLDGVVGHGVSLLPVRGQIATDATLGSLLAQTRNELLQALDHQNYSFGALIRDLHLPRDSSRLTLVPVVVNIDNLSSLSDLRFDGLTVRVEVNSTGHEHFEIFFNLFEGPGRVELTWNYMTALFDRATIQRHSDNFQAFLEAIAKAPDSLGAPAAELLAGPACPAGGERSDPGAAGPQTITEVFGAVAARLPSQTAVRFGDQSMDYATLDARSDALAADLAGHGVQPGELVGIAAHRSLELIVAVLAVLKAGAGYVPFDPALPGERLEFMARDTGIRVLLGDCPPVARAGVCAIPASRFPKGTATPPTVAIDGDSVAYVMFTSGTTGVPKGVILPHRSVIRMLCDTDWLRLGPETVTLHSSAFAFDTSIIDIFGALLHGGCIVVPPDGTLSISQLSDSIESHGVNTLWLTTGLFNAVADLRPTAFTRVEQVIVGGDILSPGHVERVMVVCPGLTVINGYGPTESNVTTAYQIGPADFGFGLPLPIGRAIPGTQVYILDDALRPVPTGIAGELFVAGRGLALGYWNRPELTAEKFVPAPWDPDLLLYRSGDLAMDPGDGVLRFFGRADLQVKVRGYRVELTEVEAALESYPGVRQAVAVATVPEGQVDKILVAYFVPEGAPPIASDLAAYLAGKLPDFACPAFVVPVAEMPLNQNGKIDRGALPPIRPEAASVSQAPEGPTEIRLAAIWSEILGIEAIRADANFFSLGGHSLLAVRLFDRVRQEFGRDLPISTLFQNQTLRALAAYLDRNADTAVSAEFDPGAPWDTTTVIAPGPAGGGKRPLFIVGGVGGNVNNLFEFGTLVGEIRPVVGFQTRGVQGHVPHDSIEAMARENIRYMRRHQPAGPYILAGYSGGAFTALEMVRQLEMAGEQVERLFVLDTYAPGFARNFEPTVRISLRQRVRAEIERFREDGFEHVMDRIRPRLRGFFLRGPVLRLMQRIDLSLYRRKHMEDVWMAAARLYRGGPIAASVTLFRAQPVRLIHKLALEKDESLGWAAVVPPGQLDLQWVSGDHLSMLRGEYAPDLVARIKASIG